MRVETIRKELKNSDIANLHAQFFGGEHNESAERFLQHLDNVQSVVNGGGENRESYYVRVDELSDNFKITPALASDCIKCGIGLSFVDAQYHATKNIESSEIMRLTKDPQIQCATPYGSAVGKVSEMKSEYPVMKILGDSLSLNAEGNKKYIIPVEISHDVMGGLKERMQKTASEPHVAKTKTLDRKGLT